MESLLKEKFNLLKRELFQNPTHDNCCLIQRNETQLIIENFEKDLTFTLTGDHFSIQSDDILWTIVNNTNDIGSLISLYATCKRFKNFIGSQKFDSVWKRIGSDLFKKCEEEAPFSLQQIYESLKVI